MTLDEIDSAASAPREYPGLNDPLIDAIILVCALLTIRTTWRAWKARTRIGLVPTTPCPVNGADSDHGTWVTDKSRGLIRFREIQSLKEASKWAGAMLWRLWVLAFFLGAILATGFYGGLLTWWYFGGP